VDGIGSIGGGYCIAFPAECVSVIWDGAYKSGLRVSNVSSGLRLACYVRCITLDCLLEVDISSFELIRRII
jgi:hypothetical protein